tara:strand:+ start:232 stop:384 length:153 start_codon:yes stop_codon:yes gene_type:complete
MKFRKIKTHILNHINKLQSMKKLPIGAIGERDARINRNIHKLYQIKALND